MGPTGSGKTALATTLWRRDPAIELVSVDAMAVYRGLDIGTDKPVDPEVPWHLVSIVDPSEDYSVARFQRDAAHALRAVHLRGHRALYVGGTGLYHRAVVDRLELPGRFPEVVAELSASLVESDGLVRLYRRLQALDPLAASRIEPGNERRILRALEVTIGSGRRFSSFGEGLAIYGSSQVAMAGLRLDRQELDRRLEQRLARQIASGFVEEVRLLMELPSGLSKTASQAIGYAELGAYLRGACSLEEAMASILGRLRAFARRQESWFRRDPRVTWFDGDDPTLVQRVASFFEARGEGVQVLACEAAPS